MVALNSEHDETTYRRTEDTYLDFVFSIIKIQIVILVNGLISFSIHREVSAFCRINIFFITFDTSHLSIG